MLGLLALFIWWRQPRPVFAEVCREAEAGSATRLTVEVLLEQAGTKDCEVAQEWLLQLERMKLVGGIIDSKLSDLTPLENLMNIKELTIEDTQVQDFSPLAKIRGLTKLILTGRNVRDISPIAQLPNLEQLAIYRSELSDITPIAEMFQLTRLEIRNSYVATFRLSPGCKTCSILLLIKIH